MCEHHCCNEHEHKHKHGASPVKRVIIAFVITVAAMIIALPLWLKVLAFLSAYLLSGGDVLLRALKNIFKGEVFDENFLMGIATLGAFAIGEYPEAVMVMVLYQTGEYFQHRAVEKSKKSISDLMDIRPDYANLAVTDGLKKVSPNDVKINDIIVVKTGEKIPLDGVVIEGEAAVDTSALTGESALRSLKTDDEALSGCINTNGFLKIRVTKPFGESTVSKILELVENASAKKAKTENFITKFARYYTPAVVAAAVFIAVVPPLILDGAVFSVWFQRALTFLVISCPCALVISIPLSFFAGIGGASKNGVLIKGGNYIELLSNTDTVVFDKTGTLTKGSFEVTQLVTQDGITKEELLKYAAMAECYSNHPIALSLKKAYGLEIDRAAVKDVEEIAGNGVKANVEGKIILAGNDRLLEKFNIGYTKMAEAGTVIYVACDGKFLGYIVISDAPKDDAAKAVESLKKSKITTVMLTGDTNAAASYTAKKLGLDKVYSQLLPADKVEKLERLLEEKAENKSVVFVGDGINDAPVLARADVGAAMGALGSDAAIEAADIVIMDDKPSKVAFAIKLAKKTMAIVKQNIVFAIGTKVLFLILGAMGFVTMWGAVFADVGVSFIAILNAMRALKIKA